MRVKQPERNKLFYGNGTKVWSCYGVSVRQATDGTEEKKPSSLFYPHYHYVTVLECS